MRDDIRDKPYLDHRDVVGLHFIRSPGKYHYRRYYRAGLRSHIMEVLNWEDVKDETQGEIRDGLRWYPQAAPLKMLRIFRTRFKGLAEAEEELERVRIVHTFLAPDHVAVTREFLVDYLEHGRREILLCGLQDYVDGEALEPWGRLDEELLISLANRMRSSKDESSLRPGDRWLQRVRQKIEAFTGKIRRMIGEAHHVPDLAGAGNLLLTRSGDIKLVDVNNISPVFLDSVIRVDDKGYPVCDKSIEALSLLEHKILGRSLEKEDHIYRTFLHPDRMKAVKKLEDTFHRSLYPS